MDRSYVRRIAVMVAVVALTGAVGPGCKTLGGAGGQGSPDLERLEPAVPLPKGTLMAGKFDLGETGALEEAVRRHLPERFRDRAGDVSPETVVGLLLGHEGSVTSIYSEKGSAVDLGALDVDGTLVGAVHVGEHGEFVRGVEMALPLVDGRMHGGAPRYVPVTVYLPADSPQELAEQLRSTCRSEGKRESCPLLGGVEARDGHVAAGLELERTDDPSVQPPAPPAERGGGGLFARQTPAAREFLGSDSVAAFYTRAEQLTTFGFMEAGERASRVAEDEDARDPDRPEKVESVVDVMAARSMVAAPGAREIEDTSMSVSLRDGGFAARVVQTYTEHGREIAEAGDQNSKWFEGASAGGTLDARWRFATEKALEKARIPEWMETRDAGEVRRVTHLAEPVGLTMPLLTYPTGVSKWYRSRMGGTRNAPATLGWIPEVFALDLRFGSAASPPKSASESPEIQGHPTAAAQVHLGRVASLLERVGTPSTRRTAEWLRPSQRVTSRVRSEGAARVLRLRTRASGERDAAETPATAVSARTPGGSKPFEEFGNWEITKSLADQSPWSRVQTAERLIERAEAARSKSDSPSVREDLEVYGRHWRTYLAQEAERGSRWRLARDSAAEACEGEGYACELERRIETLLEHFEPTVVPGQFDGTWSSAGRVLVTRRGLEVAGEVAVPSDDLREAVEGDARDTVETLDETLQWRVGSAGTNYVIPIEAGAFASGELVAFLSRQVARQRFSRVRLRSLHYSDKPGPADTGRGVLLGIDAERSPEMDGLALALPPEDREAGAYPVESVGRDTFRNEFQPRAFCRPGGSESGGEAEEECNPEDLPDWTSVPAPKEGAKESGDDGKLPEAQRLLAESSEPRLVQAGVSQAGIDLTVRGAEFPAAEGCEEAGPTLCADAAELTGLSEQIDEQLEVGEMEKARDSLREYVEAYPIVAFYRRLRSIRGDGEHALHVVVSGDVPFAVVARLLVASGRVREVDDPESFDAIAEAETGERIFASVSMGRDRIVVRQREPQSATGSDEIEALGGSGSSGESKRQMSPEVELASLSVEGGLDAEVARTAFAKHRRELQYCYEKELVENSELEGSTKFQYTIAPSGSVVAALVMRSDVGSRNVEQCAQRKIKGWTFPEPEGGGVVKVEIEVGFLK